MEVVLANLAGATPAQIIERLQAADASPQTLRDNLATLTLGSGAFFIYLGSGQPIIDEIYGYGDWFALAFFATAVGIGLTVWMSSRFISRLSMSPSLVRKMLLG